MTRLSDNRQVRWGTWGALMLAAVISAVVGVWTLQHFAAFQAQGWASSDHSSLGAKAAAWLGLPGALPAFVVGSLSGSAPLAVAAYLLGIFLVYGTAGRLLDLALNLVRAAWSPRRSAPGAAPPPDAAHR